MITIQQFLKDKGCELTPVSAEQFARAMVEEVAGSAVTFNAKKYVEAFKEDGDREDIVRNIGFEEGVRVMKGLIKSPPSYVLGDEEDHIVCLVCDKKSYNIGDVRNLYCGNCHEFHENTN